MGEIKRDGLIFKKFRSFFKAQPQTKASNATCAIKASSLLMPHSVECAQLHAATLDTFPRPPHSKNFNKEHHAKGLDRFNNF